MSTSLSQRNRLPTLFEVLSRRTLPPVDLFTFYIYMRDQQRSVDYLDFWLDVAQHMSLCRHYVRELRRSVLVSTPELRDGSVSRRSSAMLDTENLVSTTRTQGSFEDKNHDQRLSAFLRADSLNFDTYAAESAAGPSNAHRQSQDDRATVSGSAFLSTPGDPLTDSASPAHTIARADIRASAEKILYTYLLRGSEREIVLPDPILNAIANAIEVDGRDDPEVFDEAKDYVFQAMERDAFPGFLRSKALGNLIPASSMARLIVGLLALFAGFWAAFIMIFLDVKPKLQRLWLILPFFVGIYFLMAHQYSLDPVMALMGVSEYTWMHFMKIKEPYVRSLLRQRAIWILSLTVLFVAALVVLFALVPGKRL
ncbi:RGS domain-containing protein [Peziza echinospora]|nr:RGS domain-containing protein [Peziza echinospora]